MIRTWGDADVWESYLSFVTNCSDLFSFAVGAVGWIIHFDGTRWTDMTSPTTNTFWGVWGTAADNVYAVGENGTILHYGPK